MSNALMTGLSGARVLVTGGAGLVGSTIVEQLLACGPAEVRVLDDLSRGRTDHLAAAVAASGAPAAADHVELVVGDVRDASVVRALMDDIDLVFHQAAIRITQCAAEPRLALEVLGVGTFNVVEAAADAGVDKVVAASSASVYGQADELPTTESAPPWPNDTLYGGAKVFGEQVLAAFRQTHGLDAVSLRYFNIYGPRMDTHGVYTEVIVRWMERIAAGLPPLILGDGSQTMDFVHVADVARANLLAAVAPTRGEAVNIGTGTSTSLLELASLLVRVMGADLEPEFGPERATNAVRARRADVRLARDLLGFEAAIDLEAGLADLVDWWQAQSAVDTSVAVGS